MREERGWSDLGCLGVVLESLGRGGWNVSGGVGRGCGGRVLRWGCGSGGGGLSLFVFSTTCV